MRPTVGRIVMFQAAGDEVLPAIITHVNEGPQYTTVNLEVLGIITTPKPGADQAEIDRLIDERFQMHVSEGKPGAVGNWFWPIREASGG